MAKRKVVAPPAGLSPLFIRSLRQGEEVGDRGANKGLRIRRLAGEAWTFRWFVPPRLITIGPWSERAQPGHVTLDQAREWLRRLKAGRRTGPVEFARVEAELKATLAPKVEQTQGPATDGTVGAIAKKWLASLQTRRKRPDVAKAILENDVLPFIGHLPLATVQPRDCVDLVERVVSGVGRLEDRGPAPTHAQKVLSTLKQLLAYGGRRENLGTSAAALLKADDFGIVANERDRWLDPEKELPVFWRILEGDDAVTERGRDSGGLFTAAAARLPERRTRIALRLLLLTAVRSGELRLARWEDVDLETGLWTIPVKNQKLSPKNAKKARPFVVPLSPTALGLFKELRALTDAEPRDDGLPSPWVLSSGRANGDGPYTDKALGHAMRRLWRNHPDLKKLPAASPHDCRRSSRSYLDRVGVPDAVAERVLNHSVGRIQRTYNRHDNVDERRAALVKLDVFIQSMVHPGASNVAFLPSATVAR